jgi:hypothetical protein
MAYRSRRRAARCRADCRRRHLHRAFGYNLQRSATSTSPFRTFRPTPGEHRRASSAFGYGAIASKTPASTTAFRSARSAAPNGLGSLPTRSQVDGQRQRQRNVVWNTYDDSSYWGLSNYDRRHTLNIYYIYDLPFEGSEQCAAQRAGRVADFGGDVLQNRHAVRSCGRTTSPRRRR